MIAREWFKVRVCERDRMPRHISRSHVCMYALHTCDKFGGSLSREFVTGVGYRGRGEKRKDWDEGRYIEMLSDVFYVMDNVIAAIFALSILRK